MQNMTEMANEAVTTEDMAKGKKGKAARGIGEVEVAQGEAAHDAARTTAPMEAQLEQIERREAIDEMVATLHPDAEMDPEAEEAEIEAAIGARRL